jgi:hypothetical protein
MQTALANGLRRLNLPPGKIPPRIEDLLRRLEAAEERKDSGAATIIG